LQLLLQPQIELQGLVMLEAVEVMKEVPWTTAWIAHSVFPTRPYEVEKTNMRRLMKVLRNRLSRKVG
jgi:hypothetical protein